MRIGCSLKHKQVAMALMMGRRFVNAFVAAPRLSALAISPSARSLSGGMGTPLGDSRRWLHAHPIRRHLAAASSGQPAALITAGCAKRRPRAVQQIMMSSTTGASSGDEICRAAHILCADEDGADAALTRIKGGEQFGDVAGDMSSCPSKEKGGDLGWFKKGQMVAEFEAACFENEPGTIVKVQTHFGWHVVALLSRAILPRQMSVEELGEIMELKKSGGGDVDNKYQFIDVREEDELAKAKLSGFVNLPLSQFEEWGNKLTGEGGILDADKETVIVCHHGMRSNQMAQHLATKAGFKKVWNVEGGLDAYAKQVDPSVGVY